MKSGRLRGILWHQGEGDATEELAPTYRDRFAEFIARLRADLDAADVPVVVGELGEYLMAPGDRHKLRAHRERATGADPAQGTAQRICFFRRPGFEKRRRAFRFAVGTRVRAALCPRVPQPGPLLGAQAVTTISRLPDREAESA